MKLASLLILFLALFLPQLSTCKDFIDIDDILSGDGDGLGFDTDDSTLSDDEQMLMKVNVFTRDLEKLFKSRDVQRELTELEEAFSGKQSMRAGSLLAWYYLMGKHDDPEGTRNWTRSSGYLKKMVKMAEKDERLTRGSSHKSFLLFLLQ